MKAFTYCVTAIGVNGAGGACPAVAGQQKAAFCCFGGGGPNNATLAAITWDFGFLPTSDSWSITVCSSKNFKFVT
jgi:hypothetical protein